MLVLCTSATLWTLRDGSASTDVWSDVEIDWDRFPVVYADSAYADFDAPQRFVLVFRPKNCYAWEDQIQAWYETLRFSDDMDLLGVLEVPYLLTGRRFAKREGLPFPVVLDSTGWFGRRFEVSRTPFLVLISSEKEARVVRMGSNQLHVQDKVDQLLAEMLEERSD